MESRNFKLTVMLWTKFLSPSNSYVEALTIPHPMTIFVDRASKEVIKDKRSQKGEAMI